MTLRCISSERARHAVCRWFYCPGAEEEARRLSGAGPQGRKSLARARRARISRMRGRGREARQADIVSAERENEAAGDRGVSWIVYKSRKHRDRVNAKVMIDSRLAGMLDVMKLPFDGKRMIYGGFEMMLKF